MKKWLIAVLASLSMSSAYAEEIVISEPKVRKSTPEDCSRLKEEGKQVLTLRGNEVGEQGVIAALLRPSLVAKDVYRSTLPFLISFVHLAYGEGKELPADDLLESLDQICRSSKNTEWTYFR